ncbi:hypothetical protein, partial [Roseibium sp. RKSG952]|uniref:hypothetical protein n=1 Tax=Roseibium sp. RKSG952 TaxID=2529384 RepID=UPI0012BBF3AF
MSDSDDVAGLPARIDQLLNDYGGIAALGLDQTITLDKASAVRIAALILKTGGSDRWFFGTIGDDNLVLQRSTGA